MEKMRNRVCTSVCDFFLTSRKVAGYSNRGVVWCVIGKEVRKMQRKLLTNGNAFKRTDNRWCGVVWYMDEHGERKRKSFSGTTKAEVNKKMTDYIADFENQAVESDESKETLSSLSPSIMTGGTCQRIGAVAPWRKNLLKKYPAADIINLVRFRRDEDGKRKILHSR